MGASDLRARGAAGIGYACALACALGAGAFGCASTGGAQVSERVQTMHAENTKTNLYERGKAFAEVGDATRAEQYLSAALDAGEDPRKVVPLLLRVCIQDKRYRAAIGYAEDYARKHPTDAGMKFVLGTLYGAVGDAPAARAAYEATLATQPDNAQAHYALGVLLRDDGGDLVGMDRHFREYLRLAPTGEHAEEARGNLLKSVPAVPAP